MRVEHSWEDAELLEVIMNFLGDW